MIVMYVKRHDINNGTLVNLLIHIPAFVLTKHIPETVLFLKQKC